MFDDEIVKQKITDGIYIDAVFTLQWQRWAACGNWLITS